MALSLSYYGLRNALLYYGIDIMETSEFQRAFLQEHHFTTTVAEHSINVAVISLMICAVLNKLHVKFSTEAVVQAALCHDLGIIGREDKFRNDFECCFQHPLDSVEVTRELLPDCDEKTLKAIETHMWPVRPGCPKSVEGFIITTADKYAAIMECAHRTSPYHCRHITFRYVTV